VQNNGGGEVAIPSVPGPGEVTAAERLAYFLSGALGPEDLTDDEVLRCQIVGRNGKFSGRGANMVPRKMVAMIQRELKWRMEQKFQSHVDEAVDTIVDIMREGEGEQYSIGQKAGTKRLDAAKYVVERFLGPIPKEVHISDERTPWQDALESGELLVDVQEPPVVYAEVVEESESPPSRAGARARRRRGERG
jgi:hypothetical protein